MRNNIFLTGSPSAGKTAVIKQVIERMNLPASGFYIEEARVGSGKVGFVIKTLDGREGRLAHSDIKSVFNIRKYGSILEILRLSLLRPLSPLRKTSL